MPDWPAIPGAGVTTRFGDDNLPASALGKPLRHQGRKWSQLVRRNSGSIDSIARTYGRATGVNIIDIDGGASRLVDSLLAKGFENITVLDLSAAALNSARARLGDNAYAVKWIVADATEWWPTDNYDIWHDRAAFHFLTSEMEQHAYIERLKRALKLEGYAISVRLRSTVPKGAAACRCSGIAP
jgi:trans-aconitate methyltransferase